MADRSAMRAASMSPPAMSMGVGAAATTWGHHRAADTWAGSAEAGNMDPEDTESGDTRRRRFQAARAAAAGTQEAGIRAESTQHA